MLSFELNHTYFNISAETPQTNPTFVFATHLKEFKYALSDCPEPEPEPLLKSEPEPEPEPVEDFSGSASLW